MTTKNRLVSAALLASVLGMAGSLGGPVLPEPPARTKRPQPVVDEYKTAAQKKRERKQAKRSRNGAKQ